MPELEPTIRTDLLSVTFAQKQGRLVVADLMDDQALQVDQFIPMLKFVPLKHLKQLTHEVNLLFRKPADDKELEVSVSLKTRKTQCDFI